MYNIGKMRHRISLLRVVTDTPILNLDNGEYEVHKAGLHAQRIKRLDKESIALNATENITRVDFIIRTRDDIDVDMLVECGESRYNILGFEEVKDNPRFTLIATQLMR